MSPREDCRRRTARSAFTLVEMLVVISIITILAGILLPVLTEARSEARIAYCINNLHQIGVALNVYAHTYGNGEPYFYPPWVTMLTTLGGTMYLDPRSLQCKDDMSRGVEGGRPDKMQYENQSRVIDQFEMADIDENPWKIGPTGKPYLDGSSPRKNHTNGGINCSYLYEMNGEPCDWIYTGGPPITPGSLPGVPGGYEWLWETSGGYSPPTAAQFLTIADRDENGVLSWNEVKMLSRKGHDDQVSSPKIKIQAWGNLVPVIRCYWHVKGQRVLRNDSLVLDLLGDASAVRRGVPPWYTAK